MKIEVIPLEAKHLEAMNETDRIQNYMRLTGAAFVMLSDGEPVAAGGICRVWGKVGKAWMLHTEKARASQLLMRRIHRHVKIQMVAVRDAMGLERLEADTINAKPFRDWLERCGFEFEGLMRKYRDGETYARFAWLR